jgi:hypothetical protein
MSDSFSHDEKDGAMMVGASIMPAVAQDEATINKALNGACDGCVHNVGASETGRYSVSLQGHPGRELTGVLPNGGKFRSRIYLVHSTLFQVLVVGLPNYVDSPSSKQFISSFTLL